MEDPVARGRRAEQLLADDLITTAFAALEIRYVGDFRTSQPEESATREAAYTKLRVLQDFKDELQRTVTQGKMAERRMRGQ